MIEISLINDNWNWIFIGRVKRMNFFSKKTLKVKRENMEDGVRFNVEYFKFDAFLGYKSELLKKMMGSGVCMAVINTKCMYKEQNKDYSSALDALFNRLSKLNIRYKKVAVKRKKESVIFGFTVNQSNNKTYQEYIIGLIIEPDNIEAVAPLLDGYNLHYFIDHNKWNADALLDKFGPGFDDEESIRPEFQYYIFEDNFLKHMVIYCKEEDSELIGSVLNKAATG